MATSHKLLRRTYLRFNSKFFANRLPPDADVLFAPLDDSHACAEREGEEVIIQIDTMHSSHPKVWKQDLLHEMAHVSSDDWTHGKKFQAEIDRLYVAGAYKGLL